MPAMFSVPARRHPSWDPPWMRGSSSTPCLPDVERAHALGAVELVRRQAEQVHIQGLGLNVHRDLAGGLHRVGVEQGTDRVDNGRELPDWLDHADLVVGHHDRDQGGVHAQRSTQGVGRYEPFSVHLQIGNRSTLALQEAGGVEDSRVFDGRGNQMTSVRADKGDALEGQIVGLGAAAGEYYAPGSGTDQRGYLPARLGHRLAGVSPHPVDRGGVAECAREVRCRPPAGRLRTRAPYRRESPRFRPGW